MIKAQLHWREITPRGAGSEHRRRRAAHQFRPGPRARHARACRYRSEARPESFWCPMPATRRQNYGPDGQAAGHQLRFSRHHAHGATYPGARRRTLAAPSGSATTRPVRHRAQGDERRGLLRIGEALAIARLTAGGAQRGTDLRRRRSFRVVLHHGLDDREFLQREKALLASVTALLHAAERQFDAAAGAVAIDEDLAGPNAPGDAGLRDRRRGSRPQRPGRSRSRWRARSRPPRLRTASLTGPGRTLRPARANCLRGTGPNRVGVT